MTPHVVFASFVFAIDVFGINQGILSVGFAVLACLVCLGRGLAALIGNQREQLRATGLCFAIYLALAVGVVASIYSINVVAEQRAESVIDALETYRRDSGDYPPNLRALVPRYLDEQALVAKPVLFLPGFMYSHGDDDGGPFLAWFVTPPFGRRTYRLDERRWGYVD